MGDEPPDFIPWHAWRTREQKAALNKDKTLEASNAGRL
jgi:hypothetical protein